MESNCLQKGKSNLCVCLHVLFSFFFEVGIFCQSGIGEKQTSYKQSFGHSKESYWCDTLICLLSKRARSHVPIIPRAHMLKSSHAQLSLSGTGGQHFFPLFPPILSTFLYSSLGAPGSISAGCSKSISHHESNLSLEHPSN